MIHQCSEIRDCVIIGSGPAGYTAAVYAARANLKPLLIQGLQPGGQLTITTDVENFPGFPDGIQGPELMLQLEKQARRFDTLIEYATVTRVDFSKRPFTLVIDEDREIKAKGVIIATGASARWLGLESETRLNGRGVSACAVCDGFFFKGKEVAIVGAGDSACEEALYLSNICRSVQMIVRRKEMRASKIMQQKVRDKENIQIHYEYVTEEILGAHSVQGVRIKNVHTGAQKELAIAGFFVAIGHTPNSALFKDFIETDEQGYIKTVPGSARTNIAGVFAAGDVQDKVFRQAVTAAGSGCMAAIELERFLMHQGA